MISFTYVFSHTVAPRSLACCKRISSNSERITWKAELAWPISTKSVYPSRLCWLSLTAPPGFTMKPWLRTLSRAPIKLRKEVTDGKRDSPTSVSRIQKKKTYEDETWVTACRHGFNIIHTIPRKLSGFEYSNLVSFPDEDRSSKGARRTPTEHKDLGLGWNLGYGGI